MHAGKKNEEAFTNFFANILEKYISTGSIFYICI